MIPFQLRNCLVFEKEVLVKNLRHLKEYFEQFEEKPFGKAGL
jgi:hypothetical protein